MKKTGLLMLAVAMLSCTAHEKKQEVWQVEHKGALRDIMRKGDISAKFSLSELKGKPNVYALGAVEKLKGEFLILNSQPFVASVVDSAVAFDTTFQKNATLIVYATVPEWVEVKVPNDVATYGQLEQFIEKAAADKSLDVDEPFPFRLLGTPKSVDWHLINWKDGDTEHSHEKHIRSGLYGTLTDTEMEILGFYSDSDRGVFTHHTTNMHLHFITEDQKLTAHLDDMVLGENMVLKLPKTTEQ